MVCLPLPASADSRLILFDQSDFGAKKGWYISLENQSPEDHPLPIETLRLILAIGNGKEGRFAEARGFHLGEMLNVSAKIGPDGATVDVDGKEVARIDSQVSPNDSELIVGKFPDWAASPTTYALERLSFRVAPKDGAVASGEFPSGILPVFQEPKEKSFRLKSLASVALSFKVHIGETHPLDKPLVDDFGQVIGAKLPNPVRSEADLRIPIADEANQSRAWKRDKALDPFGGSPNAGWREQPTGFYRVVKHGERWTLMSPQGNPLFYTGLCTAPAPNWDVTPTTGRELIFASLPAKGELWSAAWDDGGEYFSPIGWSLKRKYGEDWKAKAQASMKDRLEKWGFTGMGKWSEPVSQVPRVNDLSTGWPKLVRHLDPFDLVARDKARASIVAQLASVKGDPYVVGNSIGNEYDETVTLDEISKIQSGADSPAKSALTGLDPETARKKYATAYYKFLYDTVKSVDPDHLYFGYWIVPGWWQNESDWDLIAPYCDVIGYDRYTDSYAGMEEREKRTGKPTLLGEFSFPAWYGGIRGYGRYSVFTENDDESGKKYAETVSAAAQDPYCIGALWFQYRDEPVTGRGPGKGLQATIGEHFAFGFVDVNDRPKWDLVRRARQANLTATGLKTGKQ